MANEGRKKDAGTLTQSGSPDRAQGTTRLVVHDFSGHPFQVQLARQLAARGGEVVTHLYCPSFLTPKGNVDDDANGFRSIGIHLRKPFEKYSGPRRLAQEIEYGLRLVRQIGRLRPDVVISANTPLIAALVFQIYARLRRVPVVFWQQDVYSVAMAAHLGDRTGLGGRIGRLAGGILERIEAWLLRSSAQVVVISEDFCPTLERWGVDPDRVHVVQNWAPLDEIPVRERPNQWSKRHDIADDQTVFLYAGTLGLKHEPSILLELGQAFAHRDDVRVIVASEGIGANWLAERNGTGGPLELLPFQDYADLPDMLGAADVLIVLLEEDAGTFSVPSKVLTYHCAGRAILGAMPADNLASRNIEATGSGVVVEPGDGDAFVREARGLVDELERRRQMGHSARTYAERVFDIDHIGDRFEGILARARSSAR